MVFLGRFDGTLKIWSAKLLFDVTNYVLIIDFVMTPNNFSGNQNPNKSLFDSQIKHQSMKFYFDTGNETYLSFQQPA